MKQYNFCYFVYLKVIPIVRPVAPFVSETVEGPYNVQTDNVPHKYLRVNGSTPRFVPEIYGHNYRQNKAE